jgi:hypothetical protein
MVDSESSLAIALFGEILTVHQLIRNQLDRVLPKGMELSHFSVLNHLANTKGEKTPAQLAKSFHVTRGAMTNTLGKLEISGYIHIRPDWDDASWWRSVPQACGRVTMQSPWSHLLFPSWYAIQVRTK